MSRWIRKNNEWTIDATLDKGMNPGAPATSIIIPWKDKSLVPHPDLNDADGETRAGEIAQDIKDKELRHSSKLAAYEKARRKEISDYKPTWVKKGRKVSEIADIMK